MSRWRKVDVRVWNDRAFMSLSQDARLLWLYLLTCPETTAIPGVIPTGQGAIGDALEWSPERFQERFAEVSRQGLAKADFKARLVWLPKAIKYDPPPNGNVVKGWRDHWNEVPECDLKHEAWQVLKRYTERFAEQFQEAMPEPPRNRMAIQEQEQEQEQDLSCSPPASEPELPLPKETKPRFDLEAAYRLYPRKQGKAPGMAKARKQVRTQADYDQLLSACGRMAELWAGHETEFCPHWSTFVSQERWRDDELPAPSKPETRNGRSSGPTPPPLRPL